MIKKALIATTLTLAAASAQAELIEYDWETAGDRNVTLDTQSGNIWLDLELTASMSINDVKSLVKNNSRFSGWRLPTLEEVYELAANTFNVDPSIRYAGTQEISGFQRTQHALFGYNTTYTYGLYEDNKGSYLFGTNSNGLYLNFYQNNTLDYKVPSRGVYLVSTDYNTTYDAVSINGRMGSSISDVSAPIALGAFGLMLGFAGMRLRKSS